ncbi:DUF3737 family protein [Lactobacillus sp. ESL0681]|uniref:DUF3737 family protein n=1 Tax=Lactobacillus sp. ESL0681 TaxID=2983211 RepID=UPI0023F71967|nr:DUF3737 family protein [Lactobacillus sp. ESL0681]WEV39515.1 DUF3737 family protein [Lactobacillus sp. ESL0681]
MKKYQDEYYEGERPLFGLTDAQISNTTFGPGESPLKEGRNLQLTGDIFKWKYPLWYCDQVEVKNTLWETMARSGVWYTNHLKVTDSVLQAPKNFRRCQDLKLTNVTLADAEETCWDCQRVTLENVQATGDYFGMNSKQIKANNLRVVGNYAFDGASDVEIHDSVLITKDAFWNCQNVTISDSVINGEYLGWNTKNLTLINCTIESDQGLCYVEKLTMRNCRLLQTTLSFEYSTEIDAEIASEITSVKNPISGVIKAEKIGTLIMDDTKIDPSKTKIITQKD